MSETTETNDDLDPDAPVTVADKPREPTQHERELRSQLGRARQKLGETARNAEASIAATKAEYEAKIAQASEAADRKLIRSELKAAALAAGMVDLDGLLMADVSAVKLAADGSVEGAAELMAILKKAKPYLFGGGSTSSTSPAPKDAPPATKSAKDMAPEEYAAAKAALVKR